MTSTLDANKKTFDSDTTLALHALGHSSPVKKGPKIDFKKLQNQDVEEGRSDSRPTTPTNFNSGTTVDGRLFQPSGGLMRESADCYMHTESLLLENIALIQHFGKSRVGVAPLFEN
jgi:hypothetical protein